MNQGQTDWPGAGWQVATLVLIIPRSDLTFSGGWFPAAQPGSGASLGICSTEVFDFSGRALLCSDVTVPFPPRAPTSALESMCSRPCTM